MQRGAAGAVGLMEASWGGGVAALRAAYGVRLTNESSNRSGRKEKGGIYDELFLFQRYWTYPMFQ